jgi:hypothetical protein
VRLWHDDVRPPPPGWIWVRTNQEAKEVLLTGIVLEASLDHDLGLHDVELPDDIDEQMDVLCARGQAEETGFDLCVWMVENNLVPPRVRIHSWNPPGAARMAGALSTYCHLTVEPYVLPRA